jgi:hypothetical protein
VRCCCQHARASKGRVRCCFNVTLKFINSESCLNHKPSISIVQSHRPQPNQTTGSGTRGLRTSQRTVEKSFFWMMHIPHTFRKLQPTFEGKLLENEGNFADAKRSFFKPCHVASTNPVPVSARPCHDGSINPKRSFFNLCSNLLLYSASSHPVSARLWLHPGAGERP